MTDHEINDAFQAAWAEFGDDKSTEFLLQFTADILGIEVDDVVAALANVQEAGDA